MTWAPFRTKLAGSRPACLRRSISGATQRVKASWRTLRANSDSFEAASSTSATLPDHTRLIKTLFSTDMTLYLSLRDTYCLGVGSSPHDRWLSLTRSSFLPNHRRTKWNSELNRNL